MATGYRLGWQRLATGNSIEVDLVFVNLTLLTDRPLVVFASVLCIEGNRTGGARKSPGPKSKGRHQIKNNCN